MVPESVLLAQIRGAEYAAAEIVWWMVASLLVGILLGWIVRGFRAGRRVEAEYQERLEDAASALRDAEDKTTTVEGHLVTAVRDLERTRSELQTVRATVADLEADQSASDETPEEDSESGEPGEQPVEANGTVVEPESELAAPDEPESARNEAPRAAPAEPEPPKQPDS